ncbi:MAG: amidohydrolase family protein [Hyphomicrobiaceae bacterium]
MNIIDAHHHIWQRADLPWLQGPTQPRIFGPHDAIKRDYLIDEFQADTAASGVVKSVYVQANWPIERFVDEVAWVQHTSNATGWPHAIVGYCDLTQPDARSDLERLRAYPAMRGIRQQLHWHENPLYRFAAEPDLARNRDLQRNVAMLEEFNWCFDLQVFAPQVGGACDLVDDCPKVTFILQHAGMLEDLSGNGREVWRKALADLAERPNVVAKLSGLGTFIHRNDAAHIAAIVMETVAIFGAERCMFGSNFPIEKLWTGYDDLVDAYRQAIATLSVTEQQAIFHGTAARVYRL